MNVKVGYGISLYLGITVGLSSCVVPPDEIQSTAETPAEADREWYNCLSRETWSAEKQAWCNRLEALKNSTYILPGIGEMDAITAALSDGQFEDVDRQIVVFFADTPGTIASGDLADGTNITTALLSSNTGGSGIFVYLAAMVETSEGYENLDSIMLGDRVKVRSIDVEEGQIRTNLIIQGDDDLQCCPTLEVNQTYALQGDSLVLIDQETVGTIPHDFGRSPYIQIDPPADAVLTGDDPRLMALEIYGIREPVEGNFQEDAVLIERDPNRPVVVLTQTGLPDDSVEGIRYRIEFTPEGDLWRISWVGRQTRCYPGRGHQDWSAEICS